jgi:L-aspartate oxidase
MSARFESGEAGRPLAFDDPTVHDVVIVGSGVAGLTAALGCAPRSVALLTKADTLGTGGSSVWAQGGVAAAVGEDDAAELHAADTLAAGAGLCDPEAVGLLTAAGGERVRRLLELGALFDRDREGRLVLGREAAHSRRRILHARGDATGAELVRTLVAALEGAPEVDLFEACAAEELVVRGGRVVGVLARRRDGRRTLHRARAVVLATGGIGHLYRFTTNPAENTGDGLAMAARAGVLLADLEMVQFHPTALAAVASGDGAGQMPLVTEALRGEGAILIDDTGHRFMPAEHPDAELAPRDVVARASGSRIAAGQRVFLDARAAVGEDFPRRFPTVFELCTRHGVDPRCQPIPVAPAAHYHMGGVAVDLEGRTSLAGLWACGEVASTGVHGANRLASNSLLEAMVFGARVATDLRVHLPARWRGRLAGGAELPPAHLDTGLLEEIRDCLWRHVGLVRDGAGLQAAFDQLADLARRQPALLDPAQGGAAAHGWLVARMVTEAALARRESRGSHWRSDFPASDPAWRHRLWARWGADGRLSFEAAGESPSMPATATARRAAR